MTIKPTLLEETCATLGVHPDSLKGVSVLFLPENIGKELSKTELYETDDSIDLVKFFKSHATLSCKTAFDLGLQAPIRDRRGVDIWFGVVWILEKLAVPTVAKVFQDWVSKRIAKMKEPAAKLGPNDVSPTIHIDIRVQNVNRHSSLKFDGSAEDFLLVMEGLRRQQVIQDDRE